jgi:tRNA nucleotidyltransferase (CCA-adding enzyme)
MSLRIPRRIKEFGRVFLDAGFDAYLVGGAVRNLLLGEKPADYDIATNALPGEVRKLFRRVIPTGIRHGTVTVLFKDFRFEVTTYRTESGYSDSRRPDEVTFVPSLEEDLKRRDFSINAIALHTVSGDIADPHGGREDLRCKIIRAIGIPEERFNEDGLRLIRGCRFSCQLNFMIEKRTLAGMRACRQKIRSVSAERIRDEIDKILLSSVPSTGFLIMEETGLLDIVLPELSTCRGVTQKGEHHFDVLDHSLYSCDGAPLAREIRLAALFHDLGKPAARKELPDGTVIFHGHENISANLSRVILQRLKYSKAIEKKVVHLVKSHMFSYDPEWTAAAVRRFLRRIGKENIDDLFDLRIADGFGMRRSMPSGIGVIELRKRIESVVNSDQAISIRDLAVNGTDLGNAGVPKGPLMGTVLEFLLETVIDDPTQNNRDALLDLALHFYDDYIAGI